MHPFAWATRCVGLQLRTRRRSRRPNWNRIEACESRLLPTSLVSGVTATGTISAQEVVHTFQGNVNDTVMFEYASPGIGADVEIWDPSGNRIKFANGPSGNILVPERLTQTGVYKIKVWDGEGKTGGYTYTFAQIPGGHTLPAEEGALTSGVTRSNTLTTADIDLYTFDGAKDETALFDFARTDSDQPLHAFMYAPSGELIAFWRDANYYLTSPRLPVAGKYTVAVYDPQGDPGSYNFTFVKAPGTHSLPAEEGALVSGVKRSNTLTTADIDVYTFAGAIGDQVQLEFARTSGNIWPLIEVFDPTGKRIDYSPGPLSGVLKPPRLTVNGTYTITVRDPESRLGSYDVTLRRIGTPELIDSDPARNEVLENSPNGTRVGLTMSASGNASGTVTYSLVSNANGRFSINSSTGVITVAKSEWIDTEAAAAWSVTVLATAPGGYSLQKAFTITLVDVN
ncbi:MAG TPA: cadherin repeat domain-containing protein, partial [Chthoniobacteraceae bacterium]|nr:cadherin repeat domain-containing protein [Chthoniobacteraceae bacterium]